MTTYTSGMLYIGKLADLDPNEGQSSSNASLASSTLGGHSYGDIANPLFAGSTLVSMNDTSGNGQIPFNDYDTTETISYTLNGNTYTTAIDSGFVVSDMQVLRVATDGGTETVTTHMRFVQDVNGNLFIMPPPHSTSYPEEVEALTTTPIIGITFPTDSAHFVTNYGGIYADRTTVPFKDGYVDGTSGNDNIGSHYIDHDGDGIDANDAILPGAGPQDDYVRAGDGNDVVHSLEGNDIVYADAGDDTVFAGNGADVVHGGDGNDVLVGELGNDTLSGGAGDDHLYGDDTAGTDPAGGADSLDGGDGNDYIVGGYGNDTIHGGAGQDTIYGGDGRDSITGNGGNDLIHGGGGDDNISGGYDPAGSAATDSDTIYGDGGNDHIDANVGNDLVHGGTGDDWIVAGAGDDTVYGDEGNDTIFGNEGNDALSGGIGNDYITGGHESDTIEGGEGDDSLVGSTVAEDDTTDMGDSIRGGAGNDTIQGGYGNDTLSGGTGDDSVDGGAGNDIIRTNVGSDTVSGGEGNDKFTLFPAQSDEDKTLITDFNVGNTGSIRDGNQSNNDFVDLSPYYNRATLKWYNDHNGNGKDYGNPLEWLRADQGNDGVLNQGFIINADGSHTPLHLTLLNGAGDPVDGQDLTCDNTNVPCFAAEVMIETHRGMVAARDLVAGDLVRTRDAGFQPLRWVGTHHLSGAELEAAPKLRPIRICAGALGAGVPASDLVVSPQHRVLVRSKIAQKMFGAPEVLVAAKQLCQLDGIDIAEDLAEVSYVHFLFDEHQIVFSNGAETESLFTGPEALKSVGPAAVEEIFTIFPELRDGQARPPVRTIASGRMARRLAVRHAENRKPMVARA